MNGVSLGSDAFFPFGDNIERAHKSGVSYVAEPGGSIRDDHVIETCNKYNMAMCFTGIRLFHHLCCGERLYLDTDGTAGMLPSLREEGRPCSSVRMK